MELKDKVILAAAELIKNHCDSCSCDECPFVYYTNDEVTAQWCKLADEGVIPRDWRIICQDDIK